MSKFKEIERRFNIGYAPSVYGTVANARLQMQNDLGELISEFKKLTIPNVVKSFFCNNERSKDGKCFEQCGVCSEYASR